MNRLVSINLRGTRAADWKPREAGGRVRMLVISLRALGWRTYSARLEQATADRDDIDAFHLVLETPPLMRLINHRVHGTSRSHLVRPTTTWAWQLAYWLRRGRLALDDYDVVFVAPHTAALGVARQRRRADARFRYATSCDTTGPLFSRNNLPHLGPAAQQPDPLEREIFSPADLISVWAPSITASLVSDYGIDASRVLVSPPVVDDAPVARALEVRRRAGAGPLPRILFVGNDWQRKGGEALLRWHQAHFADRAELHVASSSAPIDRSLKNVVWHGALPNDRLLGELLPTMDLFVFPTRVESAPVVIAEAASFGLPVVTYRVGFIPDMVVDGQTGFLLTPGDEAGSIAAIDRLLSDPALRARMSDAARAHGSQRFGMKRTLDALLDRLVQLRRG